MQIFPISNLNTKQTSFRENSSITKTFLYGSRRKTITQPIENSVNIVNDKFQKKVENLDNIIKILGFTKYKPEEDKINFWSKTGFFQINKPQVTDDEFNTYMVKQFCKESAFGGILNYLKCVNDIKRQDLIKKALGIKGYETNSSIPDNIKEDATKRISKIAKSKVEDKKLFFFGSEAFYYDFYNKKIYSTNMLEKASQINKPHIKTTSFIFDKKGNTIGYENNEYDVFAGGVMKRKKYVEQQAKSTYLKDTVEYNNNKELAEAFRFGNTKMPHRLNPTAEEIIEKLTTKCKIYNAKIKDLTVAKYVKDKKEIMRICYFDNNTGNSFVFNTDGKFLYFLQYTREPNGDLKSCLPL